MTPQSGQSKRAQWEVGVKYQRQRKKSEGLRTRNNVIDRDRDAEIRVNKIRDKSHE